MVSMTAGTTRADRFRAGDGHVVLELGTHRRAFAGQRLGQGVDGPGGGPTGRLAAHGLDGPAPRVGGQAGHPHAPGGGPDHQVDAALERPFVGLLQGRERRRGVVAWCRAHLSEGSVLVDGAAVVLTGFHGSSVRPRGNPGIILFG